LEIDPELGRYQETISESQHQNKSDSIDPHQPNRTSTELTDVKKLSPSFGNIWSDWRHQPIPTNATLSELEILGDEHLMERLETDKWNFLLIADGIAHCGV
jgi:hypothetical protein